MLKSNETKVSDNRPQWLKNPGHRMWVVVSVESNYGADDLSSNLKKLPRGAELFSLMPDPCINLRLARELLHLSR